MGKTLGAIAPNEKDIMKRGGAYSVKRKPNAIPSGSAMPLDRKKNKELATSNSSQGKLNNIMKNGCAKDFGTEGNASDQSGTSIFDPVLTELAYRWFSPKEGLILDPFAGGSVRGIVASKLGRKYVGVELRPEQVEANIIQGDIICNTDKYKPEWICGDSRNIIQLCENKKADFIIGCPPYADLEVYSDDPLDLSTLNYDDFKEAYFKIIKDTCSLLNDNSFACFIVGEVRSNKNNGSYYNFVGDTVKAFIDAGMNYYNEAILLTAIGSLPIRAARAFESSRKLGKTHQNVLIFVKGDAKKATEKIGEIEFGEVEEIPIN
jgi:DNA modification methylase